MGGFEVRAHWLPAGAEAVGVYEAGRDAFIRCAGTPDDDRVLADRLAGDREPSLPLARGLRFVVGVQQQPPTERAAAVLSSQELQRGGAQRGRLTATLPVPVVGQ